MQPKVKRVYLPKIKVFLTVGLVALVAVLLTKVVVWGGRFREETGLTPTVLWRLVFDNGAKFKAADGRTNILILGIGGGAHEGADLTDTMIVLSLDTQKRLLAMISIPRDIWSETLKDKVNSAYHYGEEKQKGGGFILTKAIVEDVVGIPIHYAFMIDFSGFKEVIDLVGGVKVNVPKAFTDPEFPIVGKENDPCDGDPKFACRYEALHFETGLQLMNGDLALKYVRSRHAEGDEGSDFARSRRQQDVLLALKTKLTDPGVWFFQRPLVLYRALDEAMDTDMKVGELLTVGKVLARVPADKIKKISLDQLFTNPPLWLYGGRYILTPKEDYPQIHDFIQKQLQ